MSQLMTSTFKRGDQPELQGRKGSLVQWDRPVVLALKAYKV